VHTTNVNHQLVAVIGLLNEIVAAGLDRDAVCELVAQRAMKLTEASGAAVELVDGNEMVYHRACGTALPVVGMRFPLEDGLSGKCVKMQIPLTSEDTETDSEVNVTACHRVGAKSLVCVPLFHQDKAIGVLGVISSEKRHFDDSHMGTLALLASVIGSSMANADKFLQAQHESLHDPLTGLWNRRAYERELELEFKRAKRYTHPLTLLLVDLDNFKRLNDAEGHPAGDQALKDVSAILRRSVRNSDKCFRIGGDEFAVLLPETATDGADNVVGRISHGVAALKKGIGVTVALADVAEYEASKEAHAAVDEKLVDAKAARKARR
jgi:diguanylate cyclase (GGDEF)-like protein